MDESLWVVHKRAFVTLGHNSLPSACLGVGHKGIVQSAPVGPASLSWLAATRKPNASSCWLPACRFLTSIGTPASPGPPVPTAGGLGILWTPSWPRVTPWLWCPSTASGGAGWTPWAISTTCNGPLYLRRVTDAPATRGSPPGPVGGTWPRRQGTQSGERLGHVAESAGRPTGARRIDDADAPRRPPTWKRPASLSSCRCWPGPGHCPDPSAGPPVGKGGGAGPKWLEGAGRRWQPSGGRRRRFGCGRGSCVVAAIGCSFSGVSFVFRKTIIPDSEEHFLTPSACRDTHLFGGSGFRFVIRIYPVRMVAFTIKPDCAIQ